MIIAKKLMHSGIVLSITALALVGKTVANNSLNNQSITSPKENTNLTSVGKQASFLKNLVVRSDLIFRGKLTDISQRLSIEEIPYTFVTYDVKEVITGQYSKDTITLKFIGGQFPNGNRLTATNTPDIQLGEESILMVQQNRDTGCDFVECEHGRFVLENGKIIAANESAIVVDSKGGVDYISLAARKRGEHLSSLSKANIPGFISHIKNLDKNSLALRKNNRVSVVDIDKHLPFKAYSALSQANQAPPVPKNTSQKKSIPRQSKGSQFEQWEVEQLNQNAGNPVLKKHYSKTQN